MNFTGSEFEKMMKEIPRPPQPEPRKASKKPFCRDCPHWRGTACMGICYRRLTAGERENV